MGFVRTLTLFAAMASLCGADEHGTLILHFLQQPVGQETYGLSVVDGLLCLRSSFEYTERGSRVSLAATLQMKSDLTPVAFEAKGKSYRPFSVDAAVKLHADGRTASLREGANGRDAVLPERFFTLSGYTPLSAQMMLLRYWARHGKPPTLAVYPGGGSVHISEAGHDTIHDTGEVDHRAIRLTRYTIGDVVWGNQSLWLNPRQELAAATTYAGGLPFEAIRDEYRSALPQLIRSSISDRIRELSALTARLQPLVQGNFAIVGVRLIDGRSPGAMEDATVVVRDGRISAVGQLQDVALPKSLPVIDGHGATLLPGLWEMHAHFAQTDYGPAYLAAGVTTARDCGGEFEFVTAVRELINKRHGLGPHLLLAGLVDRSGTGTFGTVWADTPEQGREVVAKYQTAGFDQIKVYGRIQPDVLKAIAAEAHRLGMTVTGHVPEGMTAMEAVDAGMDQINHFGPISQAVHAADPRRPLDVNSPAVRKVIQFFQDHHTVIDPTFAWGELLGRPWNVAIASFEPGFAKAPYSLTSLIGTAGTPPGGSASALSDAPALLRSLYEAGIPIVAGTDKALPGHSLHRELELYVQAGLTPMQVIQLATSGSATVMRMDREVGTIEPGKRADMFLVDGNPLESFADLRKVRRVITYGRVYDPAVLWKSVQFVP